MLDLYNLYILNGWRTVSNIKCYMSPVVFNGSGTVCIPISLLYIASPLNREYFLRQRCLRRHVHTVDHLSSGVSAPARISNPVSL
jgi:hypothetical protein